MYVDDVVLVGDQPQRLFDELSKKVALKKTGSLSDGQTVKFLGRQSIEKTIVSRLSSSQGAIHIADYSDVCLKTIGVVFSRLSSVCECEIRRN